MAEMALGAFIMLVGIIIGVILVVAVTGATNKE